MIPPKNQGEKIDKVIFEDIKNFYYGTKTLDEKVLNSTLKGGNISSISKILYKTENTSLALYDKSKKITCTSSN